MADWNNPDVKDISEILDTVSAKVPTLINNIKRAVYSAEAGREMGQAVGELYKSLMAAGIPASDALAMAKDYMISFRDMMGSAVSKQVKVEYKSDDEHDEGE